MGIATQIMLSITGQDQTGGAFASVANNAKKTSTGLKSVIGGAVAALGAGLAVAGIKKTIDDMSSLASSAKKAGESAEYMQRLSGALNTVGIQGVDVDSLAGAFAKMAKETGAVGSKGFEDALASIAKLGGEGERIEALSKTFGKALGANLAPLVRQGPDAFREGLRDVMAAMPAVSDDAVKLADGVSTALKNAGLTIKVMWQEYLGNVMTMIGDAFGVAPGDAITMLVASVRAGLGSVGEFFKILFGNIGAIIGYFKEDWRGALDWMWNGVKGYLKAVLDFWVQVFKSIMSIGAEFGKQIWKAIKGEGFDWSELVNTSSGELSKVGDKLKDMWKASIPHGNEILQLEGFGSVVDSYREAMDAARKGIIAQSKLATGTIASDEIGKSAKGAVKAIKDATVGAFTESGSYEALKLALANATPNKGAGAQVATPGTAQRSGADGGSSAGIVQTILDAVNRIDGRLIDLNRSLKAVEVI